MIFDKTNLFSDGQAITADVASENVIDLGATNTPQHGVKAITRDLGKGNKVQLHVQVTEDFNTLTNLAITLQKDTVENFASPEDVISVTVNLVDLVAGYVLPVPTLPRGTDQRYLRLDYNVSGTNPTTGKITAGLVFAADETNF